MAVTDRIINEKAIKQVNEQSESVAKIFLFSWRVGGGTHADVVLRSTEE